MGYEKRTFEDGVTRLNKDLFDHLQDGIFDANNPIQIPDYWQAHMDTKIAEINALNESLGSSADTFVFLPDTHFPNNSGHSTALVRYILANTSVKKVFLGGDIIEGNQGNAVDMELLRSLRKEYSGIQIFPVRGNHDAHTSDITDNQFWDAFHGNCESYCEMTDKMYYYHDNKAMKIRYIFADSVWGYGKYAAASYLTSDEQVKWIQDRITELDADWTALVVKHHVWDFNKLGELNQEGVIIKNCLDAIYDTAACKIAGVYAGHAHFDHMITTDKGYIIVTTKGDNNQISGWQNGGLKEQCFDVVSFNPNTGTFKTIRIGANGTNREFSYSVT